MTITWPYKILPQQEVACPAGKLMATEDGILVVHMKKELDFNIDVGMEMVQFMREITNETPFPVMLVPADGLNIHRETRELMRSKEVASYRLVTAIVTDNLAIKLVGNFFAKLNRKNHPTQLFKTEEEGLKWIREQLKALPNG